MLKTTAIGALVLVLACSSIAASFGAGVFVGRETDSEDESTERTEIIEDAWEVVDEHYVQEEAIDEEQMLEGAIEGMLNTLGDEGHTRYLTPEEVIADEQSSSGVYVGVGIQVLQHDEGLTVVRVFPGGSAEEEGVQPGDIIIEVDGEDVTDLPQEEVVERIRGPENTEVSVTMRRPDTDEEITFEMERREIEVSAVSSAMLEGNVALLKLDQFQARAADDLAAAMEEALANDPEGVILDLRNNPGGFVSQAEQIASMFVPENSTIFIRETRDGGREEQVAEEPPARLPEDIPLVVLTNEFTASASEIVSGAIQSAGTGTLVGEQTVGTGTVLRKFTLDDGSAIWLGVELWLTPDGDLIRDAGITPDIDVELGEDQFPYEPSPLDGQNPPTDALDDDQLEFALELILEGEVTADEEGD
ncbi:MAG: S41 family peptidase [Chloroflexota bacterium]